MEIKEIYSCEKYKVLQVILAVGEKMPLHEATSNAFLICRQGKGRITFSDRIVDISFGDTLLIKANDQHKMEILEDFCSNIILDSDATINFLKPGSKPATANIPKKHIEMSIY